MATNPLEGVFKATVSEVVGESITPKKGGDDIPMIKVHFNVTDEKVGDVFTPMTASRKANKGYFLSFDLVQKGKHAGKTGIEALKASFAESYGYTGSLNPSSLTALVGVAVELVCKANKDGFTDVQYVNLPGAKKEKRAVKHLTEAQFAAFDKAWSGTPETKPVNAASLFAQLSGRKTEV